MSADGPVATAAALRALPPPSGPPPGPLDGVVGLLLARAAPFDQPTQDALRRQQGWGPFAPEPITHIRTHGRWLATPALGRLTATTAPLSVLRALMLLEEIAPCPSADAAAALITPGLTDTVIHPGGVLTLARWYRVPTPLRLVARDGGTSVAGALDREVSATMATLLTMAGRAGYAVLDRPGGTPPWSTSARHRDRR